MIFQTLLCFPAPFLSHMSPFYSQPFPPLYCFLSPIFRSLPSPILSPLPSPIHCPLLSPTRLPFTHTFFLPSYPDILNLLVGDQVISLWWTLSISPGRLKLSWSLNDYCQTIITRQTEMTRNWLIPYTTHAIAVYTRAYHIKGHALPNSSLMIPTFFCYFFNSRIRSSSMSGTL